MTLQRAHSLQKYKNPRQKALDPYDNTHRALRWYMYQRLDVAPRLANVSPHHTVVDKGCWLGHLEVALVDLARFVIAVDRAEDVCQERFYEPRVSGWRYGSAGSGGREPVASAAELFHQGYADWFVATSMTLNVPGVRGPTESWCARRRFGTAYPRNGFSLPLALYRPPTRSPSRCGGWPSNRVGAPF